MTELIVRVSPRSSQNKIEVVDGKVKVWVSASPTDGQANEAVSRLVARAVGVPPTSVQVIRGHTSRDKTLQIDGIDETTLRQKLPY